MVFIDNVQAKHKELIEQWPAKEAMALRTEWYNYLETLNENNKKSHDEALQKLDDVFDKLYNEEEAKKTLLETPPSSPSYGGRRRHRRTHLRKRKRGSKKRITKRRR